MSEPYRLIRPKQREYMIAAHRDILRQLCTQRISERSRRFDRMIAHHEAIIERLRERCTMEQYESLAHGPR